MASRSETIKGGLDSKGRAESSFGVPENSFSSGAPEMIAKLVGDPPEKDVDRGHALRLVEQRHVAAGRYRE